VAGAVKVKLSAFRFGAIARRFLGIRLGLFYHYSPRSLSVSSIGGILTDDLPKIALITPSFNQCMFVGATIQSVLAQDYSCLQYVVQDACSTDGTEKVLKSFLDADVEIAIEQDQGQADALNRGFDRTSADLMGYLNSDDLLLPGTLHFVAKYFRDNPDVDVIYGNRLIINEHGQEIGRWILPGHDSNVLRFVDYVPQETMFWRRRVWERVDKKFNTNLYFALDWDLILRFLDAGAVFHHVPSLFGLFRVHGSQKSQDKYKTHGAKEIDYLRNRSINLRANACKRLWLHFLFLFKHVKADVRWRKNGGSN
jgi:glycosyltransferase involved in cell wall biosynthesis